MKRSFFHISFWITYLLFKTYLNFISDALPESSLTIFSVFLTMLLAQAALLSVKIPVVYALFAILNHFLTRKWNYSKSAVATLSVLFVGAVALTAVNDMIVLKWIYWVPGIYTIDIPSALYSFFLLCFVSGVAIAIKLISIHLRQKKEQEIIRHNLETELRFLKAQTNPHFLFNTLNNIYALSRKKSNETPEAVMKLSKLLRFTLYGSANRTIPVCDEIKAIENYIELEKMRYSSRLDISYHTEIDNLNNPIAPLLLLPFVENAFKHGASETRFDSYIHIILHLNNERLTFHVDNSKSQEDRINGDAKNIGLKNVTRQLELLYPDHELLISNKSDCFSVQLTINLKSYGNL